MKVMFWTVFRNHSSLVSNSMRVCFPARHMTHLRAANVSRRGSAGVRAKCCQVHDEEGMNIRAGSFQEVTRCSSKIIHGKNYFTMLLKPCMKSIKSSHLRGEKPGNVLYSHLKRWINYSDCFDTSTPPIRTTSIIWPITDPRFDSSSRIFKRFFFFLKRYFYPPNLGLFQTSKCSFIELLMLWAL